MPGESPLGTMPSEARRGRRQRAAPAPQRRLWPVFVPTAIVVILAIGWSLLWYRGALVAERTIAGWLEREAQSGRVYSCGAQDIGGFPFRIEVRCSDPGAELRGAEPPFAVKAKDLIVAAQVYQPTLLISEIGGPLTLGLPGRPPDFVANWELAQTSVRGLPTAPRRVSFVVAKPHVERAADGGEMVFEADRAELHGRIASGSPSNNPVIEAVLRLTAAAVPKLHPLVAQPFDADVTAVLRGLQDFSPKPWSERFREIQAAGGNIEITRARVQRDEMIAVAAGTLTLNANGRLDGLVRVAIAGVERIVPLLGVDRMIGQGLDKLTGSSGASAQGLGGLDRLIPGLSGAVRQTANAALIDNIKKMGEPTEVDKKPAIVLPLRFTDGSVYLGLIPLGQVPALF